MRREEDQELWDLLGKAAQPPISPFFARNVVRQVRQEQDSPGLLRRWFSPRRLIPAAAVALALFVSAVSVRLSTNNGDSQENLPETVAQLEAQDYEIVADLDDLLATEEDGLWDDDTSVL